MLKIIEKTIIIIKSFFNPKLEDPMVTLEAIFRYQRKYNLVIEVENSIIYLKINKDEDGSSTGVDIGFIDDNGFVDTEWLSKEVKLLKYLDKYYGEKNANT